MKVRWLIGLALAVLVALLVVAACGSEATKEARTETDSDDDILPPGDDDGGGGNDDDDDATGDDDDADDDDSTGDDDSIGNEACHGDAEPHTIKYATWEQVPEVLRTVLFNVFQDTGVAQDFYGRFVYWYGVMREGSRGLRDYYDSSYPGARWAEEVLAAQMAVAYIRLRGENLNLSLLSTKIDDLYDVLDSPVPPTGKPETYFNNHQEQILGDPQKFFWYQIYWAKQAIDDEALKGYALLLAGHVCGNIDADALFTPSTPFTVFDDPGLAEDVFEIYNLELATWKLRFNPKLTLVNQANTGLVSYE